MKWFIFSSILLEYIHSHHIMGFYSHYIVSVRLSQHTVSPRKKITQPLHLAKWCPCGWKWLMLLQKCPVSALAAFELWQLCVCRQSLSLAFIKPRKVLINLQVISIISEDFNKYLDFRLICYLYKWKETKTKAWSPWSWALLAGPCVWAPVWNSARRTWKFHLGRTTKEVYSDSRILWQSAAWLWADLKIYGLAQISWEQRV